jgi:hypothetical protein
MPASKPVAGTIELGYFPAAVKTIRPDVADEPRPLAAKATRTPVNGNALLN